MDRELLDAAARRGVIEPAQVDALMAFADEYLHRDDEDAEGEEQLRFVRSFGDIFITLGVLFVTIAMAQFDLVGFERIAPIVVLTATAEWLVRVRRLALPGIALLLALLYFVGSIVGFDDTHTGLISSAAVALVSGAYFWRYRMPFSTVPLTLGLFGVVLSVFGLTVEETLSSAPLVIGLGGLVFVGAMGFDASDRERRNWRSDTGFWLHLLAAPLLVHGSMSMLLANGDDEVINALITLAFFGGFVLVALFIDRRAMLVSSLGYAIASVGYLLTRGEFELGDVVLTVIIGFGVFVILIGAYWAKLRRVLFAGVFGDAGIARHVPPFRH
ncbi:MAG: hypothetical protein H6926_03180 [Chromatiales bacterium]|nr:hypothetical protein [Gammaproteobacteria bacterium]MCP5352177.1 hypothetical protein [Chromatiales bacterium]